MTENKFQGFSPPTENYSKLPHEFIERLPMISSLGELKVILYVLRHTWGFQENEDWDAKRISINEFSHGRKKRDGTRLDSGTGLSRQTIMNGLKEAVNHGFLICLVDNTDIGRITHYYYLRTVDSISENVIYATDPSKPGTAPWFTIPKEIKENVYDRFQGRCAYCERKSTKWHYDHIVPKSRGGSDEFDNLALACPQCNLSKYNKTPSEWGRLVIYYENDEKVIYEGWSKFLTRAGLESRPGVVKNLDPVHRKKPLKETEENTKLAQEISEPEPIKPEEPIEGKGDEDMAEYTTLELEYVAAIAADPDNLTAAEKTKLRIFQAMVRGEEIRETSPDYSFLTTETQRRYLSAFIEEAGDGHIPRKSDHNHWRKTIQEWMSRGYSLQDIRMAVNANREANLSIKGPQSIKWALLDKPWINKLEPTFAEEYR